MSDIPEYTNLELYCKATECGIGDKLYCSTLIGDLQEAAERGSYDMGFGTDLLKTNELCWIILKMRLNLVELPSWHDTFKIRTWGNYIDKFYFGRDFEIFSSDGRLIGRASCHGGSNLKPFSTNFPLSSLLFIGLFALDNPYSSVVTGITFVFNPYCL